MLEVVKSRIKELEEIAGLLPANKNFTAQARLIEAKYILELLKTKGAKCLNG